jgi:hypothetical protein
MIPSRFLTRVIGVLLIPCLVVSQNWATGLLPTPTTTLTTSIALNKLFCEKQAIVEPNEFEHRPIFSVGRVVIAGLFFSINAHAQMLHEPRILGIALALVWLIGIAILLILFNIFKPESTYELEYFYWLNKDINPKPNFPQYLGYAPINWPIELIKPHTYYRPLEMAEACNYILENTLHLPRRWSRITSNRSTLKRVIIDLGDWSAKRALEISIRRVAYYDGSSVYSIWVKKGRYADATLFERTNLSPQQLGPAVLDLMSQIRPNLKSLTKEGAIISVKRTNAKQPLSDKQVSPKSIKIPDYWTSFRELLSILKIPERDVLNIWLGRKMIKNWARPILNRSKTVTIQTHPFQSISA